MSGKLDQQEDEEQEHKKAQSELEEELVSKKASMVADQKLTKAEIILRISEMQRRMSAAGMNGMIDLSEIGGGESLKKEYLVNIFFSYLSSLESLDSSSVSAMSVLRQSSNPLDRLESTTSAVAKALNRSSKREQKSPRLADGSKAAFIVFRPLYQAYVKSDGIEALYDLFSPAAVASFAFQLSTSASAMRHLSSPYLLSSVDELFFPPDDPAARIDILRSFSMKPETVFNRKALEVYLGEFMMGRESTTSMAELSEIAEIRVFIDGVSPKFLREYIFRQCGGRADMAISWKKFTKIWSKFIKLNEETIILHSGGHTPIVAAASGASYNQRPQRFREEKLRDTVRDEGSRALAVTSAVVGGVPFAAGGSVVGSPRPRACFNCNDPSHCWQDCKMKTICLPCGTCDHPFGLACRPHSAQKQRAARVSQPISVDTEVRHHRRHRCQSDAIVLDSGCTATFINKSDLLDVALPSPCSLMRKREVDSANGSTDTIVGSGTMLGEPVDLVPSFTNSLLSVHQYCAKPDVDSVVIFEKDGAVGIKLDLVCRDLLQLLKSNAESKNLVQIRAPSKQGLFLTSYDQLRRDGFGSRCGTALHLPDSTKKLAHASYYHTVKNDTLSDLVRFWHVNWDHPDVEKMIRIVVHKPYNNIPAELTPAVIRKYFPMCSACPIGNMARKPHNKVANPTEFAIGEAWELDLKQWTGEVIMPSGAVPGPTRVGSRKRTQAMKSFSGCIYSLLAIDLKSRRRFAFAMRSRFQLVRYLKQLVLKCKQKGRTIKMIRVDDEFITDEITGFCALEQIDIQTAIPHDHADIGSVERSHRTLQESVVKTLASSSHLDNRYWTMSLMNSIFLGDNFPSENAPFLSPYELWEGRKVDLNSTPLIPFGSIVMAHIPLADQLGTLGPRSFETVAVGHATGHKGGVQLFNPLTKRVIIRRTFKVMGASRVPSRNFEFTAVDHDSVDDGGVELAAIEMVLDDNVPADVIHAVPPIPLVLNDNVPDVPPILPAALPPSDSAVPLRKRSRAKRKASALRDAVVPAADLSKVISAIVAADVDVPAAAASDEGTRKSSRNRRLNMHPRSHFTLEVDKIHAHSFSVADLEKRLRATHTARPSSVSAADLDGRLRVARVGLGDAHAAKASSAGSQPFFDSKGVSLPAIPLTVQQARQNGNTTWDASIAAELYSLAKERSVWHVPLIPIAQIPKKSIISSKFVFDVQRNPDGSFKKLKTRLVGRGDMFSKYHDAFDMDNYAGTVRSESVKFTLAIAAELDLELESVDVKTAFLHGELEPGEIIYMRRPSGLTDADMPEIVQLDKCIYGLPQASARFREHSDVVLRKAGFAPLISDPCVYYLSSGKDFVIAMIHVDDIGFATTSTPLLSGVKEILSQTYDLSVVSDMAFYVGLHIERDRPNRTIIIRQGGYIDSLLSRWDIDVSDGTPPSTPMLAGESTKQAARDVFISAAATTIFQSKVGGLIYLAKQTRPDILFPTTSLSRRCKKPTERDMLAVDHILRYIAGTRDLGLVFHSGEGILLYATVDASYACHDDLKSHTGCTLHIGRSSGSVLSLSKKQTVTADSSTVAELIAAHTCLHEILWARNFLQELNFPQKGPTVMFEDNLSTISIIMKNGNGNKTKHIDLRYNVLRELVLAKQIEVVHLPGANMTADILTKATGPTVFKHLRPKLLGV